MSGEGWDADECRCATCTAQDTEDDVQRVVVNCAKNMHAWGGVPTIRARQMMRDVRYELYKRRGSPPPTTSVYGWVERCRECGVYHVKVQLDDGTQHETRLTVVRPETAPTS